MINVLLTSFGVLEATGDVFLFWSFHKPSRGLNGLDKFSKTDRSAR